MVKIAEPLTLKGVNDYAVRTDTEVDGLYMNAIHMACRITCKSCNPDR